MAAWSRWEPSRGSLGNDNCVLLARSRQHYVHEFPGPLSIKTVTSGRIAWRIDRNHVWVDRSTFLLLNDQQPYSMAIDAPEPVSTCCVFFRRGFVEGVFRELTKGEDRRLDDPADTARDLLFLSRLRPRSERLEAAIARIQLHMSRGFPATVLEESYLELAMELLTQAEESRKQLRRLEAARPSTRAELLVRVARGREFLHGQWDNAVTLEDAARAAGMSVFHFHRSFRRAFGMTPARYLAEKRFEHAKMLLVSGASVTEAALTAGFGSPATFSTAFRKRFGIPPILFAQKFRKNSNAGKIASR